MSYTVVALHCISERSETQNQCCAANHHRTHNENRLFRAGLLTSFSDPIQLAVTNASLISASC